MEEPCFVALRMEGTSGCTRTGRHANNHIGILPPTPVRFREIIYNLVKTFGYEICELHFDHGLHSFNREAETSSNNSRLANRRVAHPFLPELFNKTFRYLKNASVFCNILSHQHEVVVLFHALSQTIADRIDKSFF